MNVIVKLCTSQYYDAADHAVLNLDLEFITALRRRFVLARQLLIEDSDLLGLEYYDRSLTAFSLDLEDCAVFLPNSDDPVHEFTAEMDDNYWLMIPSIDLAGREVRMELMSLHIVADKKEGCGQFYWEMNDKYLGVEGRCETFMITEKALDEWEVALKEENPKCS